MNAYTLTDGTSVVSFFPEWDLNYPTSKIETVNRARSGAQYRYVWGIYGSVKFSVEYVSSSDACIVNSWWGANTPLVLYDMSSAAVCSGYLATPSLPIDHYMQPYNDQLGGIIQLETY